MGGKLGWMRVGGFGGVVFAILVVVSVFVPSQPPASDASGQNVLNYLNAHHGALVTSYFLGGAMATAFAALFFGVLATLLWERGVDRPGVTAAFGAIVITGAMATAASALVAGLMAMGVADMSEAQARLLWVVNANGNLAVSVMGGAALGLFGLVMMRMKGAWKWAGWLGLLAALMAAANLVATWADQESGLWAVFGLATLLVFLLWSAVVGVVMVSAKDLPKAA